MGGRIALIFVFLLAASLACDARDLSVTSKNEVSMVSVLRLHVEKRAGVLGNVGKNDNLCTLCEEYVSEAIIYLQQNKTQQEIISALHESCSKLQSLKKQCIILVDYYAPLFFLELNTIKPAEFCGKVNLCQQVVAYAQEIKQNSCDVCNMAIEEVITLLKDPDNQLTILELLLKECKTVEKYLPKCKVLVFEYAPLLLTNAEQFLEKQDICSKVQTTSKLGRLNRVYKPSNATLINRGHDMMLRWIGGAGHIHINGTEYQLNQLHWHTPTEHTINGRRFNLELHLVHQSADEKIAVVGILYKIGRPDSLLSMMEPYLRAVASTRGVETSVGIIDPRQIKIGSRKYYRYIGSLTTPPCDQNVTWTIVKKVRTVSLEQLRVIREAVHDEADANARPVQALNDRWLKLYRPDDDETN